MAFIVPAVGSGPGDWADLGAGTGTFTEALAEILGPSGSVIAVDRDPRAVAALKTLAHADGARAPITAAVGDLADLAGVRELRRIELDGVLFANSLHYLADPSHVLETASGLIRPGGRVVIIEYDQERANPWVPHPLSIDRLHAVIEQSGLRSLDVVARRRSRYQGEMYCAVALVAEAR